MSISTYSELKTAVANSLARDDLTAIIPDFIQLAEATMSRELETRSQETKGDKGLENCRVARYEKGKLIRVAAEAGDYVHVMGLHENVHEFCYVLTGCVELRVEDKTYRLGPDDTILFDGLLDHAYAQIETGEYVTVHIPKDVRVIERLLEGSPEEPPAE